MIWKDSGGNERADASGEISVSPGRAQCDRRRGKCRGPVYHATVACPECGKEYGRCDADGGYSGAMKSLRSHRALHHPKAKG